MGDEEKSMFHYDNLRPGQKQIYDYVHENPNNIVVIDGYSGSGKTFTLKALAHRWMRPVNVIIYKHDLLNEFEDIGKRQTTTHTVAGFFRDMFNILTEPFEVLKMFERELIDSFNNAEFILTIVNLVAEADKRVRRLRGSLVILDEYTVIRKPLLIVTLMLLKHYKIGTILCGNRYQLLNEHSEIMGDCTSYDIGNLFADKSFQLRVNETDSIEAQETDSEYNKITKYISKFSSDDWIDDFARSLIAVVFQKKLFGSTKYTDTHIAGSNMELKDLAEYLLTKEKYLSRPYLIENYLGETSECSTPKYYLDYLPLVVGACYYVDEQSEAMKAELLSADRESVVLRLGNKTISREPSTDDRVVYMDHKMALLDGKTGSIYNFPVYPANFMSALRSLGHKVTGPLDISFKKMKYRGIYAAVSRVNQMSQIVKVTIDDPISHLASCVINFGELVDPDFVMTAELLERRMNNYKYFETLSTSFIEGLLSRFFDSESIKVRTEIRDQLVTAAEATMPRLLNPPKVGADWTTSPIHEILKYKEYWLRLKFMEETDRGIWLNEFLSRTPALSSLTGPALKQKHIDENQTLYEIAKLDNLPEWECDILDFISYQKHNSEKPPAKTRFRREICDKYKNGLHKEITTEWLMDSLNYAARGHLKRQDEQDDSDDDDDDTDLTSASQSSTEQSTVASSPMKRGSQQMEEDDDIELKKKKMSNFFYSC